MHCVRYDTLQHKIEHVVWNLSASMYIVTLYYGLRTKKERESARLLEFTIRCMLVCVSRSRKLLETAVCSIDTSVFGSQTQRAYIK